MQKLRHHFFVCTNTRPPFAKPSCGQKNSNELLAIFKEEAEKRGVINDVKITGCGCLGACENGAVMVVYPESVWYENVTTSDIAEIIESHIVQNKPVERLILKSGE